MAAQIHVVDTSVLIAYASSGDLHHRAATEAMGRARAAGEILISTITFAEMMVGLLRANVSVDRLEEVMSRFPIQTFDVTRGVALASARIRAQHQNVDLPDALIIATAEVLGAELLTADRRWTKITARARLIQA